MSGSVLEAMASGLCVAATAASGMEELLGGGAGTVIQEASATAVAAAVSSLAVDPERRRQIGAVARERACGSYSLDVTADRLVELYHSLARGLHA
jgi:glycosyltransferase involved in cell wall biosynthesis